MSKQPELFLYSRASCYLCDQLGEALRRRGLVYHLIDVDTDPELRHRYGARVPVLVADDAELCEGRFDESALERLARSPGSA